MLKLLNLSKSRVNHICRCVSTSATKWQGGEMVKSKDPRDVIRVIEKKPQRLPLVKNFFVGNVDTELMAFPEAVCESDHAQMMVSRRKAYDDFLETTIFDNPDDLNNIRKMKEFGCFGSTSAVLTDAMYSVSESDGKILSYGTFLNNHQQVMRFLNNFGEASQKLKYISKLETGDFIGVPCIFESNRPETGSKIFNTQVKYNDETQEYILNGSKNFVLLSTADKDSSLFLVIASFETKDRIGNFKDGIIAMLVDGSLPGVTIAGIEESMGYQEKPINQVTISFKDVALSKSNVLKKGDQEFIIPLLNSMRLEKGVQALSGVMKPMIKKLVDHSINTKIQGIHLKDVHTIKEQLGSLASSFYVLESMIYLTSGLIDIYDSQDTEVECAMVQAFAMEAMTDFMVRPMHAVGPQAVIKGGGYENIIRDAAQFAAAGEQLDSVRQFIALSGLNYAGLTLNERVKKERNPLNNPGFVLSRMFQGDSIEKPKKKFELEHYLHPTLTPGANYLEMSILRLGSAVEIILARHGPLVFQHTVEVAKIAEAATLCYAMFAAAARASRAYCIGLRNADQEMHIANCFCFQASNKVKQIALGIDNSEYGTSEHTFKLVGEQLIEAKQYHLEHPTTRNF